jgi:glucans biosynthesis protein
MLESPRCGARTRDGDPCRSPAVRGKKRCRMHGGALGSGAPRKNRNAFKSGAYTREEIEQRRRVYDLIRQSNKFCSEIDEALARKQSDNNLPPKDQTDDCNYPD